MTTKIEKIGDKFKRTQTIEREYSLENIQTQIADLQAEIDTLTANKKELEDLIKDEK